MFAVTLCSIGFTSRWGSACIPRVFTPVETGSPPKDDRTTGQAATTDIPHCMAAADIGQMILPLEVGPIPFLTWRYSRPHNSGHIMQDREARALRPVRRCL